MAPSNVLVVGNAIHEIIEGDPDITAELKLGDTETYSDDGMTGTAMRIVNAIHAVCDARPGLVTPIDLPLTIPRHVMVV